MKIIFLHDNFPPQSFGGGGISVQVMAHALAERGHEVFVVTTCRTRKEEGVSKDRGVRVFRVYSNYHERWRWYVSLYNPLTVGKLRRVFEELAPDIVHINNVHYHLSYHAFKLAKKYARAVVFTARDVMTFNFAKLTTARYLDMLDGMTTWRDHIAQAGKRWNPLRNTIIKHYLSYADAKYAISHALVQVLAQNDLRGFQVIYNGIDLSEWTPLPKEVGEKFSKKRTLQGKKVILFGGRLSPAKGGEKAIRALSLIVQEIPDVVLLVIGKTDAYAEEMKAIADELGVRKQLVFAGWVEKEELRAAYAASDIVWVPSVCFDSFGRINIEAMVSHKPVVGTRYGGTPEIVKEGKTGYVVDPRDPNVLAEKSLLLLKNPDQALRFGEAGYKRACEKFDIRFMAKEYEKVYKTLLRG